jgi:hypothetical protein
MNRAVIRLPASYVARHSLAEEASDPGGYLRLNLFSMDRAGRLMFTRIGRQVMFRQEWLGELIDRNAVLRKAPRRESTRRSN